MKLNLTLNAYDLTATNESNVENIHLTFTMKGEDIHAASDVEVTEHKVNVELLSSAVIATGGMTVSHITQSLSFDTAAVRLVVGRKATATATAVMLFNSAGSGCEVIDALDSELTEAALSANQGRILNNRLVALEEAANPISLNVSISPTSLQKKGTSTTVTLTISASRKDGTSVQVTDIKVNGIAKTSPVTYTGVNANTTYSVTAKAGGKNLSGSKNITFVSPIFVGFSAGSTAAEVNTSDLSEQVLRSSLGTLSVNVTNDNTSKYLWILSPFVVSKVTSDGFSADMNTAVQRTIDGSTYYCYRSAAKSALGLFKLLIS